MSENDNRHTIPRNARSIAIMLIGMIPTEEVEFREQLLRFIQDSFYKAPELLTSSTVWIELEIIMKQHIYDIKDEWKIKIIDAYVGNVGE